MSRRTRQAAAINAAAATPEGKARRNAMTECEHCQTIYSKLNAAIAEYHESEKCK